MGKITTRLAAALLGALLTLAGCGPGVGGTGTGMEPPPGTQAPTVLASLCDSDLVPLLRCTAAAGTAAAALGTQLVWLADGNLARDVQARIEGNAIDLDLACQALQFTGTWGMTGAQPSRFHGQVRNLATGEAVAATLTAVREGTGLALQIVDGQGRALSPVVVLQVMVGPVPVAACR